MPYSDSRDRIVSPIHKLMIDSYSLMTFDREDKTEISVLQIDSSEPRHEKTCLWGFRPGPTQTGLYSL